MAVPVWGRRLLGGARLRALGAPRSIVILGVVLPVVWVVLSRLVVPFDGTLHYFEPRGAGARQGLLLAWVSDATGLDARDVVLAVDGRDVDGRAVDGTPGRRELRGC